MVIYTLYSNVAQSDVWFLLASSQHKLLEAGPWRLDLPKLLNSLKLLTVTDCDTMLRVARKKACYVIILCLEKMPDLKSKMLPLGEAKGGQ